MSNPFFKTREEIKSWLDETGVKGYTIHDDLTVDVAGDVDISYMDLEYIPVQFGVVNSYFNCSNNKLTSLHGSPRECSAFQCSHNQLANLHGAPRCGEFRCLYNQLTSLIGAPDKCKFFACSNNQLTNLDGAPRVATKFLCSQNQLTSLDGMPLECEKLWCSRNLLVTLNGLPRTCKYIDCRGNPMLSDISAAPDGCGVICDRDLIARNQASGQLTGFDTDTNQNGAKISIPKPGRIL